MTTINRLTNKPNPIDSDLVPIWDSESGRTRNARIGDTRGISKEEADATYLTETQADILYLSEAEGNALYLGIDKEAELQEYAQEQAHAGDSQIAGEIWPLDSTKDATDTDVGLVNVFRVRDAANNIQYDIASGNDFVSVSGDIDAISFASKTITVSGAPYDLYTRAQKEDIQSHNINFVNWDILSDGTTDNTVELMKFRTIMLREPSVTWYLIGNGGIVGYEDNMWLIDVKNMSFNGKSTELKNINTTSPSSNTSRPLFIQRIFEGDVFNDVFDVHQGFVIADASAGDGSVFTNTLADAGKVSEGEWALVYGYDQQQFGGYLPNARYFDWKLVDTVNATTGEITFRGGNRLRNSYSNMWADGQAGGVDIGRPRIISTVRTVAQGYSADRVFPVNHSFEDTKFNAVNPLGVSWGHSSVFLNMSNFTIKNTGTFFTALGSKSCTYENIRFNQGAQKPLTDFAIEQDKLTELCVIRDTLPGHGVAGGTGVDNLVFENMSFPKDCRVRVGAKNITFNQAELLGCRSVSQPEFLLQYSDAPVESMRFNDTRIVLNDDQQGIVRQESTPNTIPNADWVQAGSRKITLTGDATTGQYSSEISIGTLFVIGDILTDGSADYGVVTDISASGANNIVTLRGSKTVVFDDTKDITFYNTNAPTFNEGCSIIRRDGSLVNQPLTVTTPAFLYGGNGIKTLKYSSLQMSDFSFGEIPYPCFIKEIRVNVLTPYVGADAIFFVEIARLEQSSQRVQIDLKTVGYRRLNSFESINLIGADTEIKNLFQTPNLQGIRCFVRSDGGGVLPPDVFDSGRTPYYEVEIDVSPIVP